MADYLVQDDGTSRFTKDDASGFLLLDTAGTSHTVTVTDSLALTDSETGVLNLAAARISQLPVEVVVQGESQARVSQLPVEVVVKGDAAARVTQVPVEVVVRNQHEIINVIWIP